ncbi:MAG: fused MFS/spermidine synthase [Pirellulales bacterium]
MTARYLAIFMLAGMPALVYQVVWQRVLTLYFGVDIYSTTVAVGAFMLGLGLGSLVGGRQADSTTRPAVWYFGCELSIGMFGILSLPLFEFFGHALAGSSLPVVVAVKFGLLLIPALLMGMTLPLMCRIVTDSNDTIGAHLSRLYGANTLGAALGALLGSYLLIGLTGLRGATYIAAAINFTAAGLMILVTRSRSLRSTPTEPTLATDSSPATKLHSSSASASVPAPASAPVAGLVGAVSASVANADEWSRPALALLSFLSGLVGLGYELVWYRMLGCLLHGTVYVFGTILCIYLLGIAAGSWASQRRIDQPGAVGRFALSQLAISLYSLLFFCALGYASWLPGVRHLLAASVYTSFHPSPELLEGEFSWANVYSLVDMPMWVVVMLGFPTWCMGYGFPNLIRAGSRSVQSLGESVGQLYFANILGATTGTLVVGLLTLDVVGSEITLALLIALGCVPALWWAGRQLLAGQSTTRLRWTAGVATMVLLGAGLAFPHRGQLIRAVHYADFPQVDHFTAAEDRTGIVVLKRQTDVISFPQEQTAVGQYRLFIDGANHGGTRQLSEVGLDPHVPAVLNLIEQPKRALCIGLGDGRTAATVAQWSSIEDLVVVELNAALREILKQTGQGQLLEEADPVRHVVADGRRWLLSNPDEKFDLIFMWPLHAAHAHSGSLFSHEFLTICRERLTDRGCLMLRTADPFTTARTIAEVFPAVWRIDAHTYLACRSTIDAPPIDGQSAEYPFDGVIEADRHTILAHTAAAPILRDFSPWTEYYLTYPWRRYLSPRSAANQSIYRWDRTTTP